MKLTGYDVDKGQCYYVDTKDGSTWVGTPYAEYGTLTRLRSGTTVREDNERYRGKAYNSLSESSGKGKPPRRRSTRDGQTLDGADKPLPTAPASPAPDGRDPEKSEVEGGKDTSSSLHSHPHPSALVPAPHTHARTGDYAFAHNLARTPALQPGCRTQVVSTAIANANINNGDSMA